MQPKRQFKYNPDRFNVLSSGGGTQSIAIICMIHAGLLPKPDVIVMADTEREASNAIEYQINYMKPLCRAIDLPYFIVKKSDYVKDDIFANKKILPSYHSEWNGRTAKGQCSGKLKGFCSPTWKRDTIRRFLNATYGQNYLTKKGVDMWLGMSLDEQRRIKVTIGKWQARYPLFEMLITRQMAIQFVEQYGLPTPPRSACWMCPNRHASEWQWMKDNVPEDFKKACEHEAWIQEKYPHLWLTKEGQPLDQIDFKKSIKPDQLDLITVCDTGFCEF